MATGFAVGSYINENKQVLVATPSDVTGTLYTAETDAQGATKTTTTIPLGARVVVVDTSAISGATSKFLWVVFNAINGTDADTKLASAATRVRIPVGRVFEVTFDDLAKCTRIDYRTDGVGGTPTCDVSLRWVL